jgi:hypothetical protein
MNEDHDIPHRMFDEELKKEAPSEAVQGVLTDTNEEQTAKADVKTSEREMEIARLKGKIQDAQRTIEEETIQSEARKKRIAELSAELEGGRFGRFLIEGVYAFILVVTVGVWTVLGFVVWMPLLVRTTTILAGSVLYASLFRDQPRVVHAQRSVHFAVRFYVKGFEHFFVFYRQRHEPDPPVGLLEPLTTMKWKELLVECVWVIGVWTVTYFVVHSLVVVLFGA